MVSKKVITSGTYRWIIKFDEGFKGYTIGVCEFDYA